MAEEHVELLCPYPGCSYTTGKHKDDINLVLLQMHRDGNHPPAAPLPIQPLLA